MNYKKLCALFFAGFLVLLIASCPVAEIPGDPGGDPAPDTETAGTDEGGVHEVGFGTRSDSITTVNFENLKNSSIYLLKVNKSSAVVDAAKTGVVKSYGKTSAVMSGGAVYSGLRYSDVLELAPNQVEEGVTDPMSHIRKFNANPPKIENTDNAMYSMSISAADAMNFSSYTEGSTHSFWVEKTLSKSDWEEKSATLRAQGTYCNIWVADTNYDNSSASETDKKITSAQAGLLRDKFDDIYPIETTLLGYEYGGGPGGDGGRDGDSRIQILIYDIVDSSGNSAAAGFFWGKDYYPQSSISDKTNYAEIFYLDTDQYEKYPEYIYSTLVHEFQHMINFNVKFVEQSLSSSTWYDEMLSETTEDIISPLIGVGTDNSNHPILHLTPYFLNYYYSEGIAEWTQLDAASYAKGFMFGAYLTRNYGGAEVLYEMLHNNTTDKASVEAAVNKTESGLTFADIVARFGQAIVFSDSIPDGAASFDKRAETSRGGYTYIAYPFDIWTIGNAIKNNTITNNKAYTHNANGPVVIDTQYTVSMRPYSVFLQSNSAWQNISGNYSITLNKPGSADIEFYLLVR